MRICILLVVCLLSSLQAHTQSLKGCIKDTENIAIPYANIVLQTTDSVFIAGTTSNEKGQFVLTGFSPGDYLLISSCMGYDTHQMILKNVEGNLDVGDIQIQESSVVLDGVTVTASRVVHQIDKQLILPTQAQIKTSSSGYDLLNKMMLPGLRINMIENVVSTADGGKVELRINNIQATPAQIKSLRPEHVIRVEYIDNPGVQFANKGVEAVINYVVRQRESGVSGGIDLTQGVGTGFMNDNVYLKVNHKRSEFGLNYYLSYRKYKDRYNDESKTFLYPDGSELHRDFEGISVPFKYTDQDIELSYNYTQPDKRVINVVFRNNIYNAPNRDLSYIIKEDNQSDLSSYMRVKDKSHTPALDLYYQETLRNNQNLTFNVVGTHISTDYFRDYSEFTDPMNPLSQYTYGVDGDRYSLIGEGVYVKRFQKARFTSGLQFKQAYTRNTYTGDIGQTTSMHTSDWYAYTELRAQLGHLTYLAGVGVSRQNFGEGQQGYTYYTFRPNVVLLYSITETISFRYDFQIVPYTPSLSLLNDIEQQITSNEYTVGNSGLKPYRSYNNRLTLHAGLGPVHVQLKGGYDLRHKPFMDQIDRVEDGQGGYRFNYLIANQKKLRRTFGQLNIEMEVIPDLLSLTLFGGVNRYDSKGETYHHTYSQWNGGVQAELVLGNFALSGTAHTRTNTLFGETIEYGESGSILNLSYSLNNLQIGCGVYYPFQSAGWKAGSKLMNKYVQTSSWTYIRDNGNMFMINLSYNFAFGKKHKTGRKTLDHSDTESGILK